MTQSKEIPMIQNLDRDIMKTIGTELDLALAEISRRLGVDLTRTRATFSNQSATIKVEVAVRSADGSPTGKDAESFKACAILFGLKPEDLGVKFNYPGIGPVRIVGALPRSKNPVLVERLDNGKTYKVRAEIVTAFFRKS